MPLSFTSTKMNLGLADTFQWIDSVLLPHADDLAGVTFFACLPHPLLLPAREQLAAAGTHVAAQDVSTEGGDITGAVSPDLLAEIGCTHTMIGHTERRRLLGETDDLVARKTAAAAAAGLVPLVCVGESERLPTGQAARHAADQTAAALQRTPEASPVILLYEPGWAIGGGRAADPEHGAEVLGALHEAATGYTARFLYGGAVVPGTYTALRAAAPWDGVALGRAAQDPRMLADTLDELLRQPNCRDN